MTQNKNAKISLKSEKILRIKRKINRHLWTADGIMTWYNFKMEGNLTFYLYTYIIYTHALYSFDIAVALLGIYSKDILIHV